MVRKHKDLRYWRIDQGDFRQEVFEKLLKTKAKYDENKFHKKDGVVNYISLICNNHLIDSIRKIKRRYQILDTVGIHETVPNTNGIKYEEVLESSEVDYRMLIHEFIESIPEDKGIAKYGVTYREIFADLLSEEKSDVRDYYHINPETFSKHYRKLKKILFQTYDVR
jgi:DNA-directed RNA polymerase specialized sigma24 family protein